MYFRTIYIQFLKTSRPANCIRFNSHQLNVYQSLREQTRGILDNPCSFLRSKPSDRGGGSGGGLENGRPRPSARVLETTTERKKARKHSPARAEVSYSVLKASESGLKHSQRSKHLLLGLECYLAQLRRSVLWSTRRRTSALCAAASAMAALAAAMDSAFTWKSTESEYARAYYYFH